MADGRGGRSANLDFFGAHDFTCASPMAGVAPECRRQALTGWLKRQGCGPIGVWGISLGAWLAGLLACNDDRLSFAVLMTPIVRMDRAIAELEFCAPIRRSLAGRDIPFRSLNLLDHRPLMDRQNILLVEGSHDLFAPPARVEELWEAWGRPPIARLGHGHISMLVSVEAMRRALRFVQERAEQWDCQK